MTWRDPKGGDERIDATCDSLRELAAAYSPILRYDQRERCFPILAESWLTHTTAAPWSEEDFEADDLPIDPFRRGTAVMRASVDLTGLQQRGGPPNPYDRPIQFSTSTTDPDSIGRYSGVNATTFLDFGGWLPDSDLRRGDADYLYAAFSELSAAMVPTLPWQLIEGRPNVPHLWVPQPVNPTTYAVIEWGGMYPRWSTAGDLSDFPTDGVPDLDRLLVLTYYYLYAMREPPPDGTSTRRLEGQWEAITLFFGCEPGEARDAEGRPTRLFFFEPPRFVAISKGIERSLDSPLRQHPNEVRDWAGVERVHAHPIIYVSAGTHRHFFGPGTDVSWNPNTNPPPGSDDLETEGGDEFPGVESLLIWGFVVWWALSWFGPVGFIIGAILFLLFFLAWLISLIVDAVNQASGDPVPSWQDNDEASGGGAQAGGGDEPPAGGSTGPDPSANQPTGTPNAGSPTGRDIVSFDVRLVDLLHHAADRTGFPPERPCEHPHWWTYSGNWGVNVRPATDNDWESGTQRVDELHRSWGYWNALRLVTWLNGGSPGP